MELSLYNVVLGPVVSGKAFDKNKKENKLVLRVHFSVNKSVVKDAIEKLFDVKVAKVNILIRKGKTKRSKRRLIKGSDQKIAFVSLKEGYSLNLFDQGEVPQTA